MTFNIPSLLICIFFVYFSLVKSFSCIKNLAMLNLTLKAENIIYSQKHYPSYGSKIATNYQYKSSLQKIKTTPTNNQQTTNDIMKNQSKKNFSLLISSLYIAKLRCLFIFSNVIKKWSTGLPVFETTNRIIFNFVDFFSF